MQEHNCLRRLPQETPDVPKAAFEAMPEVMPKRGSRLLHLGRRTFCFPVCLAPMAGFTDSVYRGICKSFGTDIVFTEMVSAKGLTYENVHTWELLHISPAEGPVAVQLFGHEPGRLFDAVRLVNDRLGDDLVCIDINMGCPAPKITNNGDGSALMRDPVLAGKVIAAAVKAGEGRVPVTVKFRKGWDDMHCNAVEFARMCEDHGAAAVTLHPRTRAAMYAGRADWDMLYRVRQAVGLPVIGNGDVCTAKDALRMRAETGVDGVMLGRGALGNPFVFEEIRAALAGAAYTQPTEAERRALALRHAELAFERMGPHALIALRKHLAWYVRGVPGAARLRVRLNACTDMEELREILS